MVGDIYYEIVMWINLILIHCGDKAGRDKAGRDKACLVSTGD